MLVSFTMENCASFQKPATLSMEATSIQMHALSLIERSGIKLLPVAAVYGANSSGKSNLLDGLVQLMQKIAGSDKLYILPFMLGEKAPETIKLQAVFLLCDKRYRLEVEMMLNTVVKETIYRVLTRTEKLLYCRKWQDDKYETELGESMKIADRKEIDYVASMENDQNALLVTALGKRGRIEAFAKLYQYSQCFAMHNENAVPHHREIQFRPDSGIDHYLEDAEKYVRYLSFVKLANPIIKQISKEKLNNAEQPGFRLRMTYTHQMKEIDMTLLESDGTMMAARLFPRIDTVLHEGGLLVVDELERSLHPLLMAYIVNLFTSPETNPGQGQLVFTTHNVVFMDKKYLRRDEIWFTEKDKQGCSSLYSLCDIKDVRSNSDYCKSYILGAFGTIPDLTEGCRDGKTEE